MSPSTPHGDSTEAESAATDTAVAAAAAAADGVAEGGCTKGEGGSSVRLCCAPRGGVARVGVAPPSTAEAVAEAAGGGAGGGASTTWALAPPMPNAETPARRTRDAPDEAT